MADFTSTPEGSAQRNSRRSFQISAATSTASSPAVSERSRSAANGSSASSGPTKRTSTRWPPGGMSIASIFQRPAARRSSKPGLADRLSVRVAAGRGKTLNVTAPIAANRPRLPTTNFGTSKPAAFLTTFPPRRNRRPRPSTHCTPRRKSRTPPKRNRPGPLRPEATAPPSVLPASTSTGSNGRCCPCSASTATISARGVPARAVNVNSAGSYSTMPRNCRVEILTPSTADSRGFVPAPTQSTRGAPRTASCSSVSVAGSNTLREILVQTRSDQTSSSDRSYSRLQNSPHIRSIVPAFSRGWRPWWERAGDSPPGNILPGLAMPSGSKAARIRCMQSISSAENMSGR